MLNNQYSHSFPEAGTDEAGRGCLAGAVFAGAVIFPEGYENADLNDSKQLTAQKRYDLREQIQRDALAWAVGVVEPEEIDKINILNASILAMHRALSKLAVRPKFVIVDGNKFKPYTDPTTGRIVPHATVVKGDGKFLSIAAASILAKTYRDDYMLELHEKYPFYGWDRNMGYPTEEHRKALLTHGITEFHRKSYGPVKEILDATSGPRQNTHSLL